jgi:hypothetical protein
MTLKIKKIRGVSPKMLKKVPVCSINVYLLPLIKKLSRKIQLSMERIHKKIHSI